MRDFRNAKAMAQTLGEALKSKSVSISHSESLEIVANMFGCRNWHILSAKIGSDRDVPEGLASPSTFFQVATAISQPDPSHAPPSAPLSGASASPNELSCSFCGKGQSAVSKMIAGPEAFICNECVKLCEDIVFEGTPATVVASASKVDEAAARNDMEASLRNLRNRLSLVSANLDRPERSVTQTIGEDVVAQVITAYSMLSDHDRSVYLAQITKSIVEIEQAYGRPS